MDGKSGKKGGEGGIQHISQVLITRSEGEEMGDGEGGGGGSDLNRS